MIKTTYRLSVSIAIFFLLLFIQRTVFAENAPAPAVRTDLTGFLLPDVDRKALIEKVELLRNQLIASKKVLMQYLEDKKLDGGDALITAIIPGGLLYAGYKELRYQQAKDQLAHLSVEIDEFADDLLAMQSRSAPATVAQLY
jgi:pyruvate/oxaloacetate carboxyltransferase